VTIDFSALFSVSPNPYVLLDPRFDIAAMNDAYLRVTGRSRDELLGRNLFEAFPSDPDSDSHRLLLGSLRRALETKAVDHLPIIKYDIPLPGGEGVEERYWSATHTPLPDADGAVAYILQHTVDVTELHRLRQLARGPAIAAESNVLRRAEAVQEAHRALVEEQAQLRSLFAQAPGFIAVLAGPEHRFLMANQAYQQLVGRTSLVGRTVEEALPEVVGQGFLDLLDQVYRSGEPFVGRGIKVALKPEQGGGGEEERWVDFVYQPFLDKAGAVAGIFVQGHDVTEQKRAADALRESEARFRLVAESAPVMLWMGDPNGKCLYLNRALRDFWGVAEADVAEFDWSPTIHPEDRARLFGPFEEGMRLRKAFHVEARYRRADGEWRILTTDARPRFGPAGEFLGMIGVNVDLTDTRRAEEQLRQLNESLEGRVVEEIAERRQAEIALQQAQKMEAIGKLTGGVAHDFNNLLQVVSGNLQLLSRDVVGNERAERRVANALAGVGRGAKLAAQLLAFGRRQPLEPRVVNIGRLAIGMEDMLRRTLGEAVEMETIVSASLWNSFVDPAQVENALLNLAINARDAMEGAGRLTVEAANASLDDTYARSHAEVEPGQYVMLAVTDTGCGMPPEVIEQVFEPFFSTKPEGKGSGLGLSMVYGFAKQSGGHVKIYSEPGHGTTVKLYFPRAMQDEDAAAPVETGPVTGGSETILVAEDDEEVRATVIELLRELGYDVLTAKDATSALAILESGVAIDLLFTDVVMPGKLRSPELARRARELHPGIAVLFTSGYTENAIVHGGRLDEGVDLLSKPYTRETLARKIRHALANQRQRDAARKEAEPVPVPRVPAPPADAGARRTILLVEDDAAIRADTAELLQALGHLVVEAGSAEDAMAALQAAPVEILVTDLGLPGISGSDFAATARAVRPGIGIVYATGADHVPGFVEGGAETLLRKPYDLKGLAAALRAIGSGIAPAFPQRDETEAADA
jgi:PAS domain S-box-containing protein